MMKEFDIERLFHEHYPQMFSVAAAIVHDREAARDVVHEVFASLLRGAPSRQPDAGYLLSAVRNRCYNYIRDCDARKRLENLYSFQLNECDSAQWPEEEEMLRRIGAIMEAELTPRCRRVMEMRFSDGLTGAEIARTLQVSETAVYKHIRNAIEIIRTKLNAHG